MLLTISLLCLFGMHPAVDFWVKILATGVVLGLCVLLAPWGCCAVSCQGLADTGSAPHRGRMEPLPFSRGIWKWLGSTSFCFWGNCETALQRPLNPLHKQWDLWEKGVCHTDFLQNSSFV